MNYQNNYENPAPQNYPSDGQGYYGSDSAIYQNEFGFVPPPPKPKKEMKWLKPTIISGVALILVIAIVWGVLAIFRGDPKKAAENFASADLLYDFDTADKYALIPMSDFMEAIDQEDFDQDEWVENFEERYGDIEDVELTISRVTVKNDLSKNKVKKIKKILDDDDLGLNIDTDKIGAIKPVNVKYRREGDKDDHGTYELYAVSYNFQWKIIPVYYIELMSDYLDADDYVDDDDDDYDDYYDDYYDDFYY